MTMHEVFEAMINKKAVFYKGGSYLVESITNLNQFFLKNISSRGERLIHLEGSDSKFVRDEDASVYAELEIFFAVNFQNMRFEFEDHMVKKFLQKYEKELKAIPAKEGDV